MEKYEVLAAGLEPARCCHRGILSPLRLPIPPCQQTHHASSAKCMPDANHTFASHGTLEHFTRMDGGGFEPPKQFAADLQSVPFGHSGTHPWSEIHFSMVTYFLTL